MMIAAKMQERPASEGREVFPPLSRLRFWGDGMVYFRGAYVKAQTGAAPAGLTGDCLEHLAHELAEGGI